MIRSAIIAQSPEALLYEHWYRGPDKEITMSWTVEAGPFSFDFGSLQEAISFFEDQ